MPFVKEITLFLIFSIGVIFSSEISLAEPVNEQLHSSFYENSALKMRGQYLNGKMQGHWTRWYSNGKMENSGDWESDAPEGLWTFWYPNGKKKAEGHFHQGDRVGIWTFWTESGAASTQSFTDNQTKKFTWKSLRIGGSSMNQSSGGSLSTVDTFWNPAYRWSERMSVSGLVGFFPIKSNQGKMFMASDVEFHFRYGPINFLKLSFEIGGGIQSWDSVSGNSGIVSLNILTDAWPKYHIGHVYAGVTNAPIPPGDKTTEYRLGTTFDF